MPITQLNGVGLHYLDAGPGAPGPGGAAARPSADAVLLLHAFPLHSGMWAHAVAALSSRHRVIAPDYRGLGKTPPSGEPSTMALLAGDVRALLGHLRVERAVVVGLSMGGYVALELFRQAPALFRGLVLCDTRAGADTPEGAAGREAMARTALERGLEWVADDMIPKLLREGHDPATAKAVRDLIRGGTPAGVAAAQRGMAVRPDSTATLGQVKVPALVIVGESDKMTPPAEAKKLAAGIHGARVEVIPAAGHLSNLENPEAFTRALTNFVDTLAD
ncbi:MAG: alpha/beta fold hydrolase [Anaeromyxobacter sp.]